MKRTTSFLVTLVAASAALAQEREFVPVTDAMLADPDPADWRMWRRTLNGWAFSPLDEIDRGNVSGLELIWTHEVGPGIRRGT